MASGPGAGNNSPMEELVLGDQTVTFNMTPPKPQAEPNKASRARTLPTEPISPSKGSSLEELRSWRAAMFLRMEIQLQDVQTGQETDRGRIDALW